MLVRQGVFVRSSSPGIQMPGFLFRPVRAGLFLCQDEAARFLKKPPPPSASPAEPPLRLRQLSFLKSNCGRRPLHLPCNLMQIFPVAEKPYQQCGLLGGPRSGKRFARHWRLAFSPSLTACGWLSVGQKRPPHSLLVGGQFNRGPHAQIGTRGPAPMRNVTQGSKGPRLGPGLG